MRNVLFTLPIMALAAACNTTVGESTTSGTGINSSGGTASGTITQRDDGKYALLLSAGGATCSAVYDEPEAGGSELRPLTCSGGQGGNATVVYGNDATPAKATYGGVGIGGGTITF